MTLDQISDGRAILAVGLGALGTDLPSTGEVTELRDRAELLDEGIDLIRSLWEGGTSHHGSHYDYECERDDLVRVRPVQERIPIWAVGLWPRPRSMQRILRCDGIVPQYQLADRDDPVPEDVRALRSWLAEHGAPPGLDVVCDGETPADDPAAAAAQVAPWADAGCTWWLETRWAMAGALPERTDQVRARLTAGPPAVSG